MTAAISRTTDTSVLYVHLVVPGVWAIVSALPSGRIADSHVRLLVGTHVEAPALLAWAADLITSGELLSTSVASDTPAAYPLLTARTPERMDGD